MYVQCIHGVCVYLFALYHVLLHRDCCVTAKESKRYAMSRQHHNNVCKLICSYIALFGPHQRPAYVMWLFSYDRYTVQLLCCLAASLWYLVLFIAC